MNHNAVVRNVNGEVIGKLLVSELQGLPREWEVLYGGMFIPRHTDLKKLLCDGNFPLAIYTAAMGREITVKSEGLEDCKLIMGKYDTVKKLKLLIHEKTRIELRGQSWRFFYDDEGLLFEPNGGEVFDDFLFHPKCTIRLELTTQEIRKDREWEAKVLRYCKRLRTYYASQTELTEAELTGTESPPFIWRHGYSIRCDEQGILHYTSLLHPTITKTINLQEEHTEEAGVSFNKEHGLGLNVYGTCPRQGCPSRKTLGKQTIHRAGYGFLRIDLKLKEFPCSAPACTGKFFAGAFTVSSGRALFRFRKMGGRRRSYEEGSTVLESFGGIKNSAMFHHEGSAAEYELIEMKTVKEDESLHVCVRCDKQIVKKVDAVLYECSHAVHHACMEKTCCVCRAEVLTDAQVKGLARSSHQQSRLDSRGSTQGTAVASTSRQQPELVLFDALTSSSESD